MFGNAMRHGGFEMFFFRYAGFEFQKAGKKGGMQDWAHPRESPPLNILKILVIFVSYTFYSFSKKVQQSGR